MYQNLPQYMKEQGVAMKALSHLDSFKELVGEDYIAKIYQAAHALAGLHICHFNTTYTGGGVAEILGGLLPLMEELGIKHTWQVVPLDAESNLFTTHLVDMLQGNVPGDIPEKDQHDFLNKLRQTASQVKIPQADLYIVHDFQLVPLAELFPSLRPAIWFLHVDTAHPNPNAEHYIRQFLDPYAFCVFNSQASVFEDLPPEQVHVITLGIDPFTDKNKFIPQAEGMQLLAHCGIDTTRPLITQVSRFDRWKNPWQVIDIYRVVKQQIPTVQVALVGAMEAADDIKAKEILKDVQNYAQGDPDIHLLYDPDLINHDEVNAFQRYSSVILQRSTREGFGLTVTEAMWKGQPIVGTSATGLRAQIIDGYNGYIADDTQTSAQHTLQLIQNRDLWSTLGEHAYTHVKTHFLFPMMVMDYLDALARAIEASALKAASD
jgi:trehalose synthase